MVGDPLFLYELNFLNSSFSNAYVWTFTTTIVAPAAVAAADRTPASLLVFDGIKIWSRVLDDRPVGNTTDQFLRVPRHGCAWRAGRPPHAGVVFGPGAACETKWGRMARF